MYQQHLKDEKSTSLTDFLLVIVFLLLAIFMRQIVDFCASLPAPWRSISQPCSVRCVCRHLPFHL